MTIIMRNIGTCRASHDNLQPRSQQQQQQEKCNKRRALSAEIERELSLEHLAQILRCWVSLTWSCFCCSIVVVCVFVAGQCDINTYCRRVNMRRCFYIEDMTSNDVHEHRKVPQDNLLTAVKVWEKKSRFYGCSTCYSCILWIIKRWTMRSFICSS